MARRSRKLNLPKLTTATVVILAVIGISVTVFASQQETTTKSEAACNLAPTLTYEGVTGGEGSLTYNLRIKSNCAETTQRFAFLVTEVPDERNWQWRFYGGGRTGEWNSEWIRSEFQNQALAYLTVRRPENITPGRYFPITVKTYSLVDGKIGDSIKLPYNVE